MPYKDPEKNKECKKRWAEKNKEKNKECKKRWAEKNKEKKKQYQKEYEKTPECKKSYRISKWKSRGILSDNFDELYEKYINTEYCELCNVNLTEDKRTTKTTRCLDHDHQTGLLRNIVCHCCNVKRG